MTGLREINLRSIESGKGRLWSAYLALAYAGDDARPVVQQTQGVRVLAHGRDPQRLNAAGTVVAFHRPVMLQAAVEVGRSRRCRKLYVGKHERPSNLVVLARATEEPLADVLIAPDPAANWPTDSSRIALPPCDLAAGRIRVWIELIEATTEPDPSDELWLGYRPKGAKHLLFATPGGNDGLEVFACKIMNRIWLPAILTSEGIELFAHVPDPNAALTASPASTWARVQLTATAVDDYAVTFLGATKVPSSATPWEFPDPVINTDHGAMFERLLSQLFQSVRTRSGIRVDLDKRPEVPVLRWRLDLRKKVRPLFKATDTAWVAEIDPTLFRTNIVSTVDGYPSVATLRNTAVQLSRSTNGCSVQLSGGVHPKGGRQIELSLANAGSWTIGDAPVVANPRLPIAPVRERLRAIYTEARLIDRPDVATIHAFAPVQGGWLQLALPNSPEAPDEPDWELAAPVESASVFSGNAAFKINADLTFELSAAEAMSLDLGILAGGSVTCETLVVGISGASGHARGLLHVADCSPAEGEILPTLRAGATREWPVAFGDQTPPDSLLVKTIDLATRTLELDLSGLPDSDNAVTLAWLRDGAWISGPNFAQANGSGYPVAARSLVPNRLGASCTLSWANGAERPALVGSAALTIWGKWLDGSGLAMTQILPSLPGIEREPGLSPASYSLRHDLPPLDDLFASIQLEDAPLLLLGEKPAPQPVRNPLATAVSPVRLTNAWQIVADNLRSTRTRYRVAFGSTSGRSVKIAGIVEPFTWAAGRFSFNPLNSKSLPLGRYWLGGHEFEGAEALAGINVDGVTLNSNAAFKVDVIGNAVARWSFDIDDGKLYDMAGVGVARAADLARPICVLAKSGSANLDLSTTTLREPADLEPRIKFWCRDLPMVNGSFSSAATPDSVADGVDTRARENAPQALYEWRIWALGTEPMGDIPLPAGFRARPLRLLSATLDPDTLTAVSILASLRPPDEIDAGIDVDPGESTPAANLIKLDYQANPAGGFDRTITRVRIVKGKVVHATGQSSRAIFEINPRISVGPPTLGDETRFGRLSTLIDANGWITNARLTMTLFGQELTFIQSGASLGALDFVPEKNEGHLSFTRVYLKWRPGYAGTSRLQVEATVTLPAGDPLKKTSIALHLSGGTLEWMAAVIGSVEFKVNHDEGWIIVEGDKQLLFGSPIAGLRLKKSSARAVLKVGEKRIVTGFVSLFAETASAERQVKDPFDLTCSLRHVFISSPNGWSDRLAIDVTLDTRSLIEWPLAVTSTAGPRPDDEAQTPFVVEIGSGPYLEHNVRASVRAAVVSSASIDVDTGRIVKPIDLQMRVDHEIGETGAPERKRWFTLDRVTLSDLSMPLDPNSFAFSPRYSGLYRGKPLAAADHPAGGIVRRTLEGSGFADVMGATGLRTGDVRAGTLAFFGAGVSLIRTKANNDHALLALPWLATCTETDIGPVQPIRQRPKRGTLRWYTAWFDGRRAAFDTSSQPAALTLGDPTDGLIRRQLRGRADQSVADARLASVEQVFFEPGTATPNLDHAPILLRSLVALATCWPELAKLDDVQPRVLQAINCADGVCRLFRPSRSDQHRRASRSTRSFAIENSTPRIDAIDADLGIGIGSGSSTPNLRIFRTVLAPKADLFGLVEICARDDESEKLACLSLESISARLIVPRAPQLTRAAAYLRDPADCTFVSPTLGWACAPILPHGPEMVTLGENVPFQTQAAVAGRLASFASTAGSGNADRPWLTSQRQVNFEAAALPGVMARSPRQLSLVPARPRAALGVISPSIVPGRFITGTLGRRPGAVHFEVTALLQTDGHPPPVKPGAEVRFSCATWQPAIMGEDRMPRSTELPADVKDLAWRRETFVVDRDQLCRIERVPSIAFRIYASSLDPDDLVVLRPESQLLDLNGAAEIVLLVSGPPAGWRPYNHAAFQLRIGATVWPLELEADKQTIRLWPLTSAAVGEMRQAARVITGDTVVACELVLAKNAPVKLGQMVSYPAPSQILQIPMIVPVDGQPRMRVTEPTLIFGDPAYDRMLGSATAADVRQIGDTTYLLATDRDTYDETSPILVMLASRTNGKPDFPAYDLSVTLIREGAGQAPIEVGRVNMRIASFLLADLGALTGKIEPGDILLIAAKMVHNSEIKLQVQLRVSRTSVMPPAPAIYNLITLQGTATGTIDAATALSASGPISTIVEYPMLEADMLSGFVRRRGLFVWRFAAEPSPNFANYGYLVKIDRSGAGQLPLSVLDFEKAIQLKNVVRTKKTRSVPQPVAVPRLRSSA